MIYKKIELLNSDKFQISDKYFWALNDYKTFFKRAQY